MFVSDSNQKSRVERCVSRASGVPLLLAGLSDASAITTLISLRFSSDSLSAKVTSADDASAHESD